MRKAILYEKLDHDDVKCTACNNYCFISKGNTGICGVRKNINGELHLLVYGQAAAMYVDPVEKKPLFHFMPREKVFSVGTVGCNFGCEFCQNWDISQSIKEAKKKKQFEAVNNFLQYGYKLMPEKIIETCKQRKIPMIAFTYNEPVIFFEYAYDTMKLAKKEGIKTIFVSNGYESGEALKKLKGYLDAINIDLKSFNPEFYKKYCKSKLEPVLETIKKCHELGMWVEVTTLIIPGENDSEEELEQIAKFIASVSKTIPWHVTAFQPQYKMLDKKQTPHQKLVKAYETGKKHLKHVYVGNVLDVERSSTYCSNCNNLLIKRAYHSARPIGLINDKCRKCKHKLEGVL